MAQELEQTKSAVDAASAAVVVGTLAGWLPSVAAVLTIAWTGIRIWETRTVQRVLVCLRNRVFGR